MNFEDIDVFEFYADWCGPCKMLDPIFYELSNELKNINFHKINVDENKKIAKKYGVMSIPTIILFKNGIEIKRNIGYLNKNQLKKFLEEL